MLSIDRLNSDFGIAGQLQFVTGQGGLPLIRIENDLARAEISLYGAQVLSYKPVNQPEDLLFLSERAYYDEGKAIRGGIPICWPWFGPDPEGSGRPSHGFVRNRHWNSVETRTLPDGSSTVCIGLADSEETREIWPYRFQLSAEISVGSRLELALATRNTGNAPMTISQALHSYFRIGDPSRVRVLGLEGNHYIDQVAGGTEKTQAGAVIVDEEVDRIYTGVKGDLLIEDDSLARRIRIVSKGSETAVVWNPWSDLSASMADLADDGYTRMLCVETANAGPNRVEIKPGDTYRLSAQYSVEGI